jgi:glutamate-1-semialdehyde 2,1-aminomutase
MSSTTETRSAALFERAQQLMPGGVNSPVRAFKAVGGTPIFFERAEGCKLYDVDGNEYIDYVSSWGAVILGHADPSITQAVSRAAQNGTSFGAPHPGEVILAQEVVERVASIERVRFVNSGTEATVAAIRLARAATQRTKILKFEGNYHGAVDSLLAKAGSGVATFGLPDSAGVPPEVAAATLTAVYNDIDSVKAIFDQNKGDIAALLVEPVAGNMGCIPPAEGFLQYLQDLCRANGTLFILDEVMTGFRVNRGGATTLYNLEPDLLCMGKVIGGGLPVGAYGGREDLMEMIAPVGPVYQAGTLSGNPLAMAAGYTALMGMTEDKYTHLEEMGGRLAAGLSQTFRESNIPAQAQRVGSMISVFFADQPVTNFTEAKASNTAFFSKLFHALLRRGVYLPPSALEAWFLNTAHTSTDIDQTVEAFGDALKEVVR